MNAITVIMPMTEAEAHKCLSEIKGHLRTARRKILELYEREGWRALGYESFQECMEQELDYSFQHGYRLVIAEKIEQSIRVLPGANPLPADPIPERHLRVLGKYADNPNDQRRIYEDAQALAATEGAGAKVKTKHVEESALLHETRVMVQKSRYFLPAQMMVKGEITPAEAKQMIDAIERLKPVQRSEVLKLMAGPGLRCADLVEPIGNMFDRPLGKESKVLPEILNAGTLGGTPLVKAVAADLQRANYEAQQQHIAEEVEKRRPVIEPVIITIYKGDPKRTFKELQRGLGEVDLGRLIDYMLGQ